MSSEPQTAGAVEWPPLPLTGADRAARVRDMFGRIVPHYDLMNRLMTGGQDVRWRRVAARSVHPAGALALDLATGTGDLAIELARQGARRVVAADYCAPMLDAARPKLIRAHLRNIDLMLADADELPFPDASFDCITNGFLLRNVVDLPHCLSEMRRVLRPGGRVAALELTQLTGGPLSAVIRAYSRIVVPRVGALVSGDAPAYQYLPASVDTFPDAERLARLLGEAGFSRVIYRRFGFGRVAIHLATVGS